MAEFYTILTLTGQAKLANAHISGIPVSMTYFAVGDGAGAYYEPAEAQTELVNEVWRGSVNRVVGDPNHANWIVVETIIPAAHGGFEIREAGVFNADNDLIAVGKYPLTVKPAPDSGAAKDLFVRLVMAVTNAGDVQLTIDPNVVTATLRDLQDHIAMQLDPGDTDEVKEKHLSNAQAHAWEVAIAANAQAIVDEAASRAAADADHADRTSAHGASSAALPGRLVVRDAAGTAKMAAPVAPDDIARKVEVDNHANQTEPHGATKSAVGSRLVVRNSNGTGTFAPAVSGDNAVVLSQLNAAEKKFGAWESGYSRNTVYQASSDGFVVAWGFVTTGNIGVYTDASNPPQTLRATATVNDLYNSVTVPVRNGDYFRVAVDAGVSGFGMFWLPLS